MGTPNCYECKYRANLPGDTHSKCTHPKVLAIVEDPLSAIMGMMSRGPLPMPPSVGAQLGITGNAHGVKMGWFNWPINFDPVWLESCNGFEENCEKETTPAEEHDPPHECGNGETGESS